MGRGNTLPERLFMKYLVTVEHRFHDGNLMPLLKFRDGSDVKRDLQRGDKIICDKGVLERLRRSDPYNFVTAQLIVPPPTKAAPKKKPVKAKTSAKKS